MKGAVFIALNEMVEERFGIDTWEEILEEVKPESEGIYTSTENYPDQEVVDYVLVISKKLDIEPSEVTRVFGKFLFGELNKKHDIFTKLSPDLFQFLNSIEGIIHKEVRKLYENPSLPTMECTILNKNDLRLKYTSPRKLCFLAEGLIFGAAEYYNEEITLEHNQCMHDGHDSCEIRVIRRG